MLTLRRTNKTLTAICGELLLDDKHFGFTLERLYDDPQHVCIPVGTYPLRVGFSNHFGRSMVHVDNVPDRVGILIHGGNHVTDSEGCVLLGAIQNVGLSYIGHCSDRVQTLLNYISEHPEWLTVIDITKDVP